jgi:hypothetical protein
MLPRTPPNELLQSMLRGEIQFRISSVMTPTVMTPMMPRMAAMPFPILECGVISPYPIEAAVPEQRRSGLLCTGDSRHGGTLVTLLRSPTSQ